MDQWDELEEFCREWPPAAESAMAQQPPGATAALAQLVSRHVDDLRIRDTLLHLRATALGGSGVLLEQHGPHGLYYRMLLAWEASSDPRPALASAAAEYQLEVLTGFIESEPRVCIRVTGERRLQAYLPVTAERFRAALMQALRSPHALPLPPPPETPEPSEPATAEPGAPPSD